ncbi:signal recognition particle, SRP19 subunit [Mycena crocata]|nr:signal recognition particle, SRP19 subunit [Mycena crocata]
MSRRAAIIEEEFDDDTDLPLPSQPLPNTGTSGPLLQELSISDDELDPHPNQRAGPASPPYAQPTFRPPPGANLRNTVTDITPYKNWTCIYPIYIDAKRAYGTGQRRVPRAHAVWWPLSKDIADATHALGLLSLHEVNKSHPRDWENPGRVRVQWKKDGKLMNPQIRTKKLLLESIAARIQQIKPQSKPVPPFHPSPASATPPPAAAPTTSGKGKQPSVPAPKKPSAVRPAPAPPLPHPPLAARVSPYSPALASGMLVDAVKAGMAAQAQEAAAAAGSPGAPGQQGPSGVQKGKRKVVRVRG